MPKSQTREPDVEKYAWVVQMFAAVLASACKQNALHPALVATSTDMKWLVKSLKAKKATGDSSLLNGWRRELFFQTFQDLWDGRQGLRLKREKSGFSLEVAPVAEAVPEPDLDGDEDA